MGYFTYYTYNFCWPVRTLAQELADPHSKTKRTPRTPAMAAGLTAPVTFQMGSTTGTEAWQVSGSSSATTGFVPLLAGNDNLSHPLPFENFYTFAATSGNVLLASISAVPGPIVGAGLPGLIAACGGLIALARRRRRRTA